MSDQNLKLATFGGGCFWCVEVLFQELNGVHEVVSGYSGGKISNPTYREVCSGRTGHAEVVQVSYDPSLISYEDILRVFFTSHDPTTLNRQGADVGTQYRSIILFRDEDEKTAAEKVVQEMASIFDDPIVTEVAPFEAFYEAEENHQNYYNQHQDQPYCAAVISPKLNKLRSMHAEKLKKNKANS